MPPRSVSLPLKYKGEGQELPPEKKVSRSELPMRSYQGRVKTPKAPGHWTCGGPPLVVNEIAPQKVYKYILEKLSSFVRVNVLYFGDLGGILGSTFNECSIDLST